MTVNNTSLMLVDAAAAINKQLVSGSDWEALLALSFISSSCVVILSLIRTPYCFTVGYGASVAVLSVFLARAFSCFNAATTSNTRSSACLMVLATAIYGVRLASFLLIRELSVKDMTSQTKAMDKYSKIQVLPLAAFLGVFYACQVSPVLFSLRRPVTSVFGEAVQRCGVILAFLGLVVETVADQHKSLVKKRKNATYGDKRFASPTGGLYALCRHPNFLGEIIFWTGVCLTPLGHSPVGCISAGIGYVGIYAIMEGSAKRLDKKQQKNYGGQAEYEEWKKRVRRSLLPSLPRRDP